MTKRHTLIVAAATLLTFAGLGVAKMSPEEAQRRLEASRPTYAQLAEKTARLQKQIVALNAEIRAIKAEATAEKRREQAKGNAEAKKPVNADALFAAAPMAVWPKRAGDRKRGPYIEWVKKNVVGKRVILCVRKRGDRTRTHLESYIKIGHTGIVAVIPHPTVMPESPYGAIETTITDMIEQHPTVGNPYVELVIENPKPLDWIP